MTVTWWEHNAWCSSLLWGFNIYFLFLLRGAGSPLCFLGHFHIDYSVFFFFVHLTFQQLPIFKADDKVANLGWFCAFKTHYIPLCRLACHQFPWTPFIIAFETFWQNLSAPYFSCPFSSRKQHISRLWLMQITPGECCVRACVCECVFVCTCMRIQFLAAHYVFRWFKKKKQKKKHGYPVQKPSGYTAYLQQIFTVFWNLFLVILLLFYCEDTPNNSSVSERRQPRSHRVFLTLLWLQWEDHVAEFHIPL